jgi:glc operon protein GlcG
MLAACEAEATKNKWAVAISIVDDGGFVLGALRMDGASAITAEVSLGKAKTSAMTKRPSKFFEDRLKERPAFAGFPAGILIQGAVPVIHENECVGAIGVSGVQSQKTNRSPRRAQARSPERIERESYSAGTPASSGCGTALLRVSPNVDTAASSAKPAST